MVVAQVAPSRAAAVSLLRQTMPRWLAPGLAAHVRFDGTPARLRDPVAYAEFLTQEHPVGDPGYCVQRVIECCEATGIERFLFFVEGGGPEHTLANIAALGRHVLPRLR